MDSENKTLFNAGVAKLMRIDKQRQLMAAARIEKQWGMFVDCLENIRTEINENLEDDEKILCNDFECKIKRQINSAHKTKKIDGFLLRSYELYLGELEHKYGYSMPNKEDDEGL
jgi:hypothetical protein